jgi:hypothetical protein
VSRAMKRLAVLPAVVATALALAAPAGADEGRGGNDVLREGLVASQVGGPIILGLRPGGRDWVIDEDHSSARVREDGRLRVRIEGLLFEQPPFLPLPGVSASVACGDTLTSSDVLVQLTDDGDAEIEDELSLPDPCADPVVFVHPNLNRATYITVTSA